MDVQLQFHSKPNAIVLACPQGIPSFESVEILLKPGQSLVDPKVKKAVRLNNSQMCWVGKSEVQHQNVFMGVLEGKTLSLSPLLMQGTLEQQVKKQMKTYESRNSALEDGLSNFQQRKMVAEEMGTNKSRRKMRQMETNKVQEENIAEAENIQAKFEEKRNEIKEQIEIEKEVHKAQEDTLKEELLPEFSRGKQPLHQIYNIKSIISDEDMDALDTSRLQTYVSNQKSDVLRFHNPYILTMLQSFQFEKAQKQIILKYIEFLNLMLKFQFKQTIQNTTPSTLQKEMHIDDISLVNSILGKFYQTTKGQNENTFNFNRSQFLKDKYICYLIVLHLFIHRFKFDAAPLSKILKLDMKKLGNYAKECGCTAEQKNGQLIVTLKPIK